MRICICLHGKQTERQHGNPFSLRLTSCCASLFMNCNTRKTQVTTPMTKQTAVTTNHKTPIALLRLSQMCASPWEVDFVQIISSKLLMDEDVGGRCVWENVSM